jgi:hypothetical protein
LVIDVNLIHAEPLLGRMNGGSDLLRVRLLFSGILRDADALAVALDAEDGLWELNGGVACAPGGRAET